ncbi:MAG: hypothetical protein IT455_04750 [Planctomycetes bacterium]|nr:hypothetical protein [Planctomycetota bacterium]
MRPLPVLILFLLLAVGLGLGLRVMRGAAVPPIAPVGTAGTAATGGLPQGHVYTGLASEPPDLNPLTAGRGVASRLLLPYVFDTLLDHDPVTGALRPALAVAFEPAADGRSCTFTLRRGVAFADGSPLTMADVLFPWQLAQAGHLPLGAINDAMARIEAVDVLDELSFRVRFRGVYYAAVEAVGEAWWVPQRRWFEARVAAAKDPEEAMPAVDSARFAELLDRVNDRCGPGTGPYRFEPELGHGSWQPHQDLLLARSENCWRRQVSPGTWNFAGIRLLFRDPAGATNALLAGELDWYSNPLLEELLAAQPELARRYRPLRYDYKELGVFRVVWNLQRPPFDDVRVRRALAHLFDLDGLVAVAGGNARPALAHAKPDSAEYPRHLQPFAFDPAATRRALRELGFDPEHGKPLRLELLAPTGTEQFRRTVELFVDACKRAAIDLVLQQRDFGAYLRELPAGKWDGLLSMQSLRSWGDPYDLLHSQGLWNHGKWSHPEADALATAARAELDAGKRADLLRRLHELAFREQPAALLVHPMASILVNSRIENLAPGPYGLVPERAFVPIEFQRR